MAKLEFTVEIAAPPDRVFVFFVPQRMPYWYGAEMESRLEVQGGAAEFQVGLKVRVTGRLGRREVSHTAVVTGFEWGRLLEWRLQDAYGVRGLQRWEIEPSPRAARSCACATSTCFPGASAALPIGCLPTTPSRAATAVTSLF